MLKCFSFDEYGYARYWKLKRKYLARHTELGRSLVNQRWKHLMLRFGAWIPLSAKIHFTTTFPHGLYGIFISMGAEIGENCVIFQQVTIGSNTLKDSENFGSPKLGKNIYIGTGAKIIGNVEIGDNVRIGANCVVTKNIPANSTVVLNQPRIIVHENSRNNSFLSWNNI